MAENAELALALLFLSDLDRIVHSPDMTGARAAEGPDVEERASDGRSKEMLFGFWPLLLLWKPPAPKALAPWKEPPGEVSKEERPERSGMSPASEKAAEARETF